MTTRIKNKNRRAKAAAKIATKYVERDEIVYNLDAKPENADWPKRTWDLGIDNVEDLRKYLANTGRSVEAFKALPVYRWNLERLPWLKEL